MSMQDTIADMLTRLRNAQAVNIKQVCLPASKLKAAILNVLQEEGYIEHFAEETDGKKKNLVVSLKYHEGRPVIEKIHRVSKPGLRVYKRCAQIPVVRAGMGITILSTPKGVMTGKAARSMRCGGELLCIVE